MSPVRYWAPKTKDEALSILKEEGPRARVVAGGTNVIPDLRAKKLTAQSLVDISGIDELRCIEKGEGSVQIGPLTTIADLLDSEIIKAEAGLLGQACRAFADPLVRHRATLGGNLANASPAADSAAPLLALGTDVLIESAPAGKRAVPLEEFFLGPNRTALGPDELITGIRVHSDAHLKKRFIKFGLRKAMAISLVSVAVALRMEADQVAGATVAFGAVAPTPIRAPWVEAYLTGKRISEESLAEAARIAEWEVSPISDIRATSEYRRHLSGVLLRRAIQSAVKEGS
ncbi:MAG: xanthine dehydrogenase family protein subunit M [Actinobacteria bacterium]|nr:xanthine dehydrogenase family protein subunit M [Actinomycetota bacterium]